MSHTIPASSITIDGPRAWWVVTEDELPQMWERPCMTCKGTNLYHNGMGADACPDCADGRHTFEIDVNVPCVGGRIDLCDHTTCGARQIKVHVVRVMPIVTWYAGGDMPWPCFEMEPDVEVVQRWQRPADAEPGKYVVEMETHS
jgi:hypothetical protein